jgi:hypothetical protein
MMMMMTTTTTMQVDDAARQSAMVVKEDAHRRVARSNEKLKLAVQRQAGQLKEARRCVQQLFLDCRAHTRGATHG